jgi:hypothetical protein
MSPLIKAVFVVLIVGTAVLALAACAPPRNDPGLGGSYSHFTTSEGLDCLGYARGGNGAGVSCNWEKFNKAQDARR